MFNLSWGQLNLIESLARAYETACKKNEDTLEESAAGDALQEATGVDVILELVQEAKSRQSVIGNFAVASDLEKDDVLDALVRRLFHSVTSLLEDRKKLRARVSELEASQEDLKAERDGLLHALRKHGGDIDDQGVVWANAPDRTKSLETPPALTRVHITLRKADMGESLGATIAALEAGFGLQNVNRSRAQFMGIATGDMPADSIESLRASGLVEAVAIDGVVSIVSESLKPSLSYVRTTDSLGEPLYKFTTAKPRLEWKDSKTTPPYNFLFAEIFHLGLSVHPRPEEGTVAWIVSAVGRWGGTTMRSGSAPSLIEAQVDAEQAALSMLREGIEKLVGKAQEP